MSAPTDCPLPEDAQPLHCGLCDEQCDSRIDPLEDWEPPAVDERGEP